MADSAKQSKPARQLPSTFANMVLVMTILSVLSAGALGLTYTGTFEQIAINGLAKQKVALSVVLPAFTNDPVNEALVAAGDERITLYPAENNGQMVGLGVQSYSDTAFGGTMTVMVGFDTQGAIAKTQVLVHTETPGLGSKVTLSSFISQFEGLGASSFPLAVAKDGGEVDAITAATISSRAYTDAINKAQVAAATFYQEIQ